MAEPTQDDLDAARRAVERYCGWHVTPVVEEDLVLDGPGGALLVLPTLRLVDVTAVTEDGSVIDPDCVSWSVRGLLRKRTTWPYTLNGWGFWWTNEFQGITVTITHGYETAPDFDKAVKMVAESMAASSLRDDSAMILKRVDNVQYQWAPQQVETIVGTHLLASYRLERQA